MFCLENVVEQKHLKWCVYINVVHVLHIVLWCYLWGRITGTVKASDGLREKLFNIVYNSKKQALLRMQLLDGTETELKGLLKQDQK